MAEKPKREGNLRRDATDSDLEARQIRTTECIR